MKAIIGGILCLICSSSIVAQKAVPQIECVGISMEKLTFPINDHALPQVVLVTFGRNAEKEAGTWIDPLVQKFIRKSGLLDAMFEAHLFALSFVSETEFLQIKMAEDRLSSEIPTELHHATLFSKADQSILKDMLPGKSHVYVLVISADGKLIGSIQGEFSSDKMELIEQWILDA